MAQERSLTPEKQLLNLIENPEGKTPSGVGAQTVKYQSLSFFSPGAWIGRFSFFKDKFLKLSKGQDAVRFDIKLINKALGGIILTLMVYMAGNAYFSSDALSKIALHLQLGVPKQAGGRSIPDVASVLEHNADYYLEKIAQRDIFSMQAAKKAGGETVPEITQEQITALAETLKVVGISWSNSPDVIIEDTKSGRTYFLKKGQTINGAKIKEVFPDKIILSYGDQEFELR